MVSEQQTILKNKRKHHQHTEFYVWIACKTLPLPPRTGCRSLFCIANSVCQHVKIGYFLLLGVCCLFASECLGQDNLTPEYDLLDANLYNQRNQNQLTDFKNHLNIFPPRPSDGWEVGFRAGIVNISGDVQSLLTPLGLSASVRKALGYVVSVRGQYTFAVARGQNHFPTFDFANDAAYQVYNGSVLTGVWRSYRTLVNAVGLHSLFNLTNIFFHGTRKKIHVYTLAGLEGTFYSPSVDALAAGGVPYNFDGFPADNPPFDGSFETPADVSRTVNFAVGLSVGAGVQYFVSDRVNLQLENAYTFTNRHDLDGSKYTGVNNPTTQNNNGINYLSLGVNFVLKPNKKMVSPLWLLNPLAYPYMDLNSPRTVKIPEPTLKDTDADGVADIFDREPNTLPGVSVDARGVTLDTDADGVSDYLDRELITPSFCRPVDEQGVGTCPQRPDTCCSQMQSYIRHLRDEIAQARNPEPAPEKVVPPVVISTPPDTAPALRAPEQEQLPVATQKETILHVPTPPQNNVQPLPENTACYNANAVSVLSRKVLFAPNSADVLPLSVVYLEDIANILRRDTSYVLSVSASVMTYETGGHSLANRRQNAVYQFFVAKGISPKRLVKTPDPYAVLHAPFALKHSSGAVLCPEYSPNTCVDTNTVELMEKDKQYFGVENRLLLLGSRIHFLPDSASIDPSSAPWVRGLIRLLHEHPSYAIIVAAPYSEHNPSEKQRQNLSLQRGKTLAKLLTGNGISENRMKIIGLNTLQPLNSVPLLRVYFPGQDSDNDCVPDDQDECPTLFGTPQNAGCALKASVQDSLNIITKSVYFDFDKSEPHTSSEPYLTRLSELIKQHHLQIVVAGSTDTIGNEAYNLDLSFKRALWIKRYLLSKGVDPQNVQALGLGERHSPNSTKTQRQRNRRVEFWTKF